MQRSFLFWGFILITQVEPNQRHLHAEQSCKFAGGVFAIDQLCQSIRLDVAEHRNHAGVVMASTSNNAVAGVATTIEQLQKLPFSSAAPTLGVSVHCP